MKIYNMGLDVGSTTVKAVSYTHLFTSVLGKKYLNSTPSLVLVNEYLNLCKSNIFLTIDNPKPVLLPSLLLDLSTL